MYQVLSRALMVILNELTLTSAPITPQSQSHLWPTAALPAKEGPRSAIYIVASRIAISKALILSSVFVYFNSLGTLREFEIRSVVAFTHSSGVTY